MDLYDCVIIHYAAEVSLKGRNRPFFEKTLLTNIQHDLTNINSTGIKREHGRIVIGTNDRSDISQIKILLSHIFGISWYAPAYISPLNLELITAEVIKRVQPLLSEDISIKVLVKRANKQFPMTSPQLGAHLGAQIVEKYGIKVSMRNPTLKIFIEIAQDNVYIFFEKIKGLGGLPTGVTGRVLCLLSGGIDSAVAAWSMMKRGCIVDYVHFHPSGDNDSAIDSKISEIVTLLAQYASRKSFVYFVSSVHFQQAILSTDPKYDLILFRRFMLRIAERIAKREKSLAIVTGDSLAQVASQTLENLNAQNSSISMSILRPLLSYDKDDIVKLAQKIETYKISIKPYRDCCSLIGPNPSIKPDKDKIEEIENELELDEPLEDTLNMADRISLP